MKLHLGCGQRYFEGYINIDFPLSEHSVQDKSIADIQTDILSLNYPENSIKEVRLHHVFEHFKRPVACALIAAWASWLEPQGRVHIEVPDFYRSSLTLINPLASFHEKAIAERHLFGSHEAHWAAHYESYTPFTLSRLLEDFGFSIVETRKNSWLGTHNFEIIAQKCSPTTLSIANQNARKYLSNFLIDNSEGELVLLQTWLDSFNAQLHKSWASNAK